MIVIEHGNHDTMKCGNETALIEFWTAVNPGMKNPI